MLKNVLLFCCLLPCFLNGQEDGLIINTTMAYVPLPSENCKDVQEDKFWFGICTDTQKVVVITMHPKTLKDLRIKAYQITEETYLTGIEMSYFEENVNLKDINIDDYEIHRQTKKTYYNKYQDHIDPTKFPILKVYPLDWE